MDKLSECTMRHENGNCLPVGGFCAHDGISCQIAKQAYEMGFRHGIRHQPDPEPLTLEQLREMVGKPVYIQMGNMDEFWALVSIDNGELGLIAEGYDHECPDEAFYGMKYDDPYGRPGMHVLGWFAYPYKPKGE